LTVATCWLHARNYFCRLIFFAFRLDVSCIVIANCPRRARSAGQTSPVSVRPSPGVPLVRYDKSQSQKGLGQWDRGRMTRGKAGHRGAGLRSCAEIKAA